MRLGRQIMVVGAALALLAGGQEPQRHRHSFFAFTPTVTNLTSRPVSVPVEIHPTAKLLLVRARFGKNLEGRFIVDTGAGQTVVSPAFARKLRVEFPNLQEWSADGTNELQRVLLVPRLALGEMQYGNLLLSTLSLDHLAKPLTTQLDGIIGGDLLFARRCAFNAAGRRLILDVTEPVGVKPIIGAGGGMVGVPLTLDGQTKLFLLDSGASRSVLPAREWQGAVSEAGRVVRGDYFETVVGLKTSVASIKEIRVNGAPLPWLKLTLTENSTRLLGMDFISRFLLTIDAEQGKVWLQPPQPFVQ